MKIHIDEQAAVARFTAPGNVKDTKLGGTRERSALNELANPNRHLKVNGFGKENKAVVDKPLASVLTTTSTAIATATTNSTTTASTNTRTRPVAIQQSQSRRVIVNRPHSQPTDPTSVKIPTTRHPQRELSAAAAVLFRPSQTRLREDEDEDNASRKRRKTPTDAARTAAISSSIPRSTDEVLVPASDDCIEITEANVKGLSNADTEEDESVKLQLPMSPSSAPDEIDYDWTQASPESEARYTKEIAAIKASFQDEVDEWDMTLVSEYSEDIFKYMGQLEVRISFSYYDSYHIGSPSFPLSPARVDG